jgi:uncharacterized membrane protein SpoIIM required for sporulation
VGGSIGVALLGTVAGNAVSSYVSQHATAASSGLSTPHLMQQAMVHSYVTAFWWASAIFALGAVIVGALLTSGQLPQPAEGAEPVLAH